MQHCAKVLRSYDFRRGWYDFGGGRYDFKRAAYISREDHCGLHFENISIQRGEKRRNYNPDDFR